MCPSLGEAIENVHLLIHKLLEIKKYLKALSYKKIIDYAVSELISIWNNRIDKL